MIPELLGENGRLHPHWETFFQSYSQLGDEEIALRNEDMMRLLTENGVTYNIYGDPSGLNRPWNLDIIPFLISKHEWPAIESGLLQRAELLNLILKDIYGERRLIRNGILPAELIYNHAGFLRQCAGIHLPGKHHLIMYSADLARSRDGRIWVVNDRTQAPSGSGYALENRTAMTRVLPELFNGLEVRHLSPYFNALRNGLHEIAPHQRLNPRIVILTPGSSNETYFEHSYLSSYLGFTLVQGNDLVVKDSHVWLKTMGGLERVDVILRRVDDIYCDPLELKEDSQLGIPGLLQAVRSGHVSIANPIGSSVLENPGLMPFLQSIARWFLSEDLRIPTIASWWCGQPKELDYVLAHLPTLVIKKINRNPTGTSSVDGASLSHRELSEWKQRIRSNPSLYVGQEKVDISSTPSLIDGKIESRKVLFRSFLVSNKEGYVAMTGGLCRTSSKEGNFIISNQSGGISKDAWILSPEPGRVVNVLKETTERPVAGDNDMLPSHAAENLFWTGRYTERVLGNARFLRTVMQFVVEGRTERSLLTALTKYSYTYPGFAGEGSEDRFAHPWVELKEVLLNEKRTGSLKYNFLQFNRAIHEVREHWSTDTWRVLRVMEEEFRQNIPLTHQGHIRMLHTLDNLITFVVAFIGLTRESISREQEWILLDLGRKIEQSLLLITMLRVTLTGRYSDQVEYNLQQSVLMSHESLVNYRYKYRMPINNELVLDLMLFDPNNPRSLTYQVDRLKTYLHLLPRVHAGHVQTEYERLILEADTLLQQTDRRELAQADENLYEYRKLDDLLSRMYTLLSAIPDVISKTYFKHELTSIIDK
ncbi:MAG: circularly permuted type 2 ATP-grasp protein [Chitinophagaceae bacterium]|nr:circularly permuted type 2 ATP-grasp protein [Chitinophagaceae bacterium]